jgi:hypothetical protein
METFSDGWGNTWYEGDMLLGELWYKWTTRPSAQIPFYMLFKDVSPIITYSHLVIKFKFSMLPNATRKGNLRFIMPLHVRENLLSIIEERQSYCPNWCTKIQNYEIETCIGFKNSCVFLVCWLYLLVNLAYMFRVGYFRLRLGYGKSYNFCLANFEVVWAKYFVVLIVKVLDHMQFQIFFSSQLLHIIQYMNSHILMKLVIY